MPELRVAWMAAVLTVGKFKFHETEGLCCWAVSFSTSANDSGLGARLEAILGGSARTRGELGRRLCDRAAARCPGDKRMGRDPEDPTHAAPGRLRTRRLSLGGCRCAARQLPWKRARPTEWAVPAERNLLLAWGALAPPCDLGAGDWGSPGGAAPGWGDEAEISPKTRHGEFFLEARGHHYGNQSTWPPGTVAPGS